MSNLLSAFIVITVLSLFSQTAFAAEAYFGSWLASGSEVWHTSFPLPGSPGNNGGASELSYPHSGNYLLAGYENHLSHNKTLFIEGGLMGQVNSAVGSDADWNYVQSDNLWYYGNFNTSGTSGFAKVTVAQPLSQNTQWVYGYQYRINHFHMTNGLYDIENYQPVNNPLPDLNSYYTTIYQGPHIGLTSRSYLTPRITLISSLAYSPVAAARGHGWWNLRQLDFTHTGIAQIIDASVGLSYANTFSLGYRYQRYSLLQGRENTAPEIKWDKATAVQRGLYFTATKKF